MNETQNKKSRKSTKIYTYKCVSFLFATIKLVKFELKNPELLSPLKILQQLNKTRTNCWNTKTSHESTFFTVI